MDVYMITASMVASGTVLTGIATIIQARASHKAASAAQAAVQVQLEASAKHLRANFESSSHNVLATVVTNARLAWVDALRDDISQFIANAEMGRAAADLKIVDRHHTIDVYRFFNQQIMLKNRIILRLNTEQKYHLDLKLLLEDIDNNIDSDFSKVQLARDAAKRLIDTEWGKVRREIAGVDVISQDHPLAQAVDSTNGLAP